MTTIFFEANECMIIPEGLPAMILFHSVLISILHSEAITMVYGVVSSVQFYRRDAQHVTKPRTSALPAFRLLVVDLNLNNQTPRLQW